MGRGRRRGGICELVKLQVGLVLRSDVQNLTGYCKT